MSIYDLPINFINNKSNVMDVVRGKVCLMVNIASKHGYQAKCSPVWSFARTAKQLWELQQVHEEFFDKGFSVVGFPCNQFGSQEPAPVERIRKDMTEAFGVQFPIFDKIDVNGPNTSPLYSHLKSYKDIGLSNISKISWNFEKFLLGPEGTPLRRYKPGIRPAELATDIKSLIATGVIPPKKRATLNEY
jgi:glutathione peroxidase